MNHVIRNYRFNALEVDVIFIQKEKKYFEKAPISRSIFSLSNIKVKCMQPAEKKTDGRPTPYLRREMEFLLKIHLTCTTNQNDFFLISTF